MHEGSSFYKILACYDQRYKNRKTRIISLLIDTILQFCTGKATGVYIKDNEGIEYHPLSLIKEPQTFQKIT